VADQLGKDGGAGGSREFSGNIDLTKWNPPQNLGGGRSGKGKGAVCTLDSACAFDWYRGGDVEKPQVMEADGSDYDIDDRIDRADLVKMDFVDQFSVKPGLGFGDAVKDFEGGLFYGGSEVGVLEESSDLSPRATVFVFMRLLVSVRVVMGIVLVRGFDKEARTSKATSERSLRFQNHFFL
jgi:hypothetical protein